jgi:hypothetical protein
LEAGASRSADDRDRGKERSEHTCDKRARPIPRPAGAGSAKGISTIAAENHLRNGRVRGFSSVGIEIGPGARVSGLLIEKNGGYGISSYGSERIDIVDSKAVDNAGFGIIVGDASKVRNSIAESNGLGGIEVGRHSIVATSSALSNTIALTGTAVYAGIQTSLGSLVEDSVVSSSDRGYGILVDGSGGLVIRNISIANANHGINMRGASSIQSNTSTATMDCRSFLLRPVDHPGAMFRPHTVETSSTETSRSAEESTLVATPATARPPVHEIERT